MQKNIKNSNRKKYVMTDGEKSKMQCEICGVYFTAKGSLKVHIASIHNKQKSYSCGFCNSTFLRKDNMKTHIKSVHEGKKPFQCDICDLIILPSKY